MSTYAMTSSVPPGGRSVEVSAFAAIPIPTSPSGAAAFITFLLAMTLVLARWFDGSPVAVSVVAVASAAAVGRGLGDVTRRVAAMPRPERRIAADEATTHVAA